MTVIIRVDAESRDADGVSTGVSTLANLNNVEVKVSRKFGAIFYVSFKTEEERDRIMKLMGAAGRKCQKARFELLPKKLKEELVWDSKA